jgi:uncharacterized membrane-anchored protein
LLTKSSEKGGLNLGTIGSSLVLFLILVFLIFKANKENISKIERSNSI